MLEKIKLIFEIVTIWIVPFFFIYYLLINVTYSILFLLGSSAVLKRNKEIELEDFTHILQSDSLPDITFVMGAYNESKDIISTVNNLIHLTYRHKKIVVVNDGSTDQTLDLLIKNLDLVEVPILNRKIILSKEVKKIYRSKLHPEVVVIDKENGGKYDALNAGLNFFDTPYFITIDADTFIDDSNFEAIIRPMLTSPEVIAVGASVRLNNECKLKFNQVVTNQLPMTYFSGMQTIEYLRAFTVRQGWNLFKCNFLISGAFTIFVTDVVVQARGFSPTVADDLEIIMRLNRLMIGTKTPYQMAYLPDPVAWTEGPFDYDLLKKQRLNWHRGLLECLWFHKSVILNPKYGRFGMFVFPMLFLGEALEPLVEVTGYFYLIVGLSLGVLHPLQVLLILGIVWMGFFVLSIYCLFLEEISFRRYSSTKTMMQLIGCSFSEFFVYRPLNLYWRLLGFFDFIRKFPIIRNKSHRINETIEQVEKKGKFRW